jgi:hypothetical protein
MVTGGTQRKRRWKGTGCNNPGPEKGGIVNLLSQRRKYYKVLSEQLLNAILNA